MKATPQPRAARPVEVLIVGDVMLDEFIAGPGERISPEAPVIVVTVVDEHDGLGGAGNVARQVVSLGAKAHLIAVVGNDDAGQKISEHCRALGIPTDGITIDDHRVSTRKQRVMVGRQQIARLDREDSRPLDHTVEQHVISSIAAVARPDVVILSDYAKGTMTPLVISAVMSAAHQWNVPVLVDPTLTGFEQYRGATLIKANRAEYEAATGTRFVGMDSASIEASASPLLASLELPHLVVTLGEAGMIVFSGDTAPQTLASSAREVADVSGAGDTVIAVLAVMLAEGRTIVEAAHRATVAAGVVVQRRGVSVVSGAELEQELRHLDEVAPSTASHKVIDNDEAIRRAEHWRSVGDTVVFTNGCFDLLHPGHLHLLRHSASLGARLIVAVDNDESVASLKGAGRPVMGQADRAALLGALEVVDVVTVFSTSDLLRLIRELAPDVLVKGADYVLDDVVGGDFVTSNGGRVELIPLLADRSTSGIVEKVRRS